MAGPERAEVFLADPVSQIPPEPGALPEEPETIPTTIVDIVCTHGILGGLIDLSLGTGRFIPGQSQAKLAITARLRLNVQAATILRDVLNQNIELLSKPEGKPN
jgi:hypothetical protein